MKVFFKTVIFFIVVYILTIPLGLYASFSLKTETISIQSTITNARKEAYEVELTGITQQVIEHNKRLVKMKTLSNFKLLKYHFVTGFNELEPVR